MLCCNTFAKPEQYGAREKISLELSALSKDLDGAKLQLQKMNQTNLQIKAALNDMETWAILQQQEKDKYYNETIKAASEISELQGNINLQKSNEEKLKSKYSRVKSILACLAGCVAAFFIFRISNLFTLTPQLKTAGYLGTFIGFGLGYMLIYFYF